MRKRKTLKLGEALSPEDIERIIEETLDEEIEGIISVSNRSSSKNLKNKNGGRA
ncbi:hypothetical protein JCM16138_12410 [Thermococcus atlanticus]